MALKLFVSSQQNDLICFPVIIHFISFEASMQAKEYLILINANEICLSTPIQWPMLMLIHYSCIDTYS